MEVFFFLAIWLVKPIGISTQFSVLSAMAYEKIDSEFVQNNAYMQKENGKLAQKLKNPLNYDLIFFLKCSTGSFSGIFDFV